MHITQPCPTGQRTVPANHPHRMQLWLQPVQGERQ